MWYPVQISHALVPSCYSSRVWYINKRDSVLDNLRSICMRVRELFTRVALDTCISASVSYPGALYRLISHLTMCQSCWMWNEHKFGLCVLCREQNFPCNFHIFCYLCGIKYGNNMGNSWFIYNNRCRWHCFPWGKFRVVHQSDSLPDRWGIMHMILYMFFFDQMTYALICFWGYSQQWREHNIGRKGFAWPG